MNKPDSLRQAVTTLDGIGDRMAAKLEKLGIVTMQDLLFHLPIRYEDKTRIVQIASLEAGMTAYIKGAVEFTDVLPRGRRSLICRINDGTGFIDLRFFHYTVHQFNALKPGTQLRCFGEVRFGFAGLEMVHPEYNIVNAPELQNTETQLTPVYPLTEGINQNTLRKAIKQVLRFCHDNPKLLKDWLPAAILEKSHYPTLLAAINTLHAPNPEVTIEDLQSGAEPALKRLAFEELLAHHLSLRLNRQKSIAWQAPRFAITESEKQEFIYSFPFELTQAQRKVMSEIETDCRQGHAMMRLVQGDVGSGKTVVAAYAAYLAARSGHQVAIMAPTELLAEQHKRNFSSWLKGENCTIALLTSTIKGNARKAILQAMAEGEINIVVGTHALFQENVSFNRLGLIIIDEQHRFGVHQRLALKAKGQGQNNHPHQLVMTATPIPRTLAMLQYADLAISIIDQLPPGRQAITTSVIPNERRGEVVQRIETWVGQRKQVYWICTLIEESELLQCESAEKTAQLLASALPKVRIGLLHGRMPAGEKDLVMQTFKNHKIDLLVATTVVEVGVDVPNASLMIIENPERLGLSQLHQLRGRVGRGIDQSYCLLLYQAPLSDHARQRLGILRDNNDGFVIAEQDLLLRGPGEIMGIRQTGQIFFKVANLARDAEILDNIPAIAEDILNTHPEIINPLIERWLGSHSDYSEV